MTNPDIDVAKIACDLTDKQRRAVLSADGGCIRFCDALGDVTSGLIKHGVLRPRVKGQELDGRLTIRGLALRKHLETNP